MYTPLPHGHNKKCFGAVPVVEFLITCSLLQVLLSEKSFPVNAGKLFWRVASGQMIASSLGKLLGTCRRAISGWYLYNRLSGPIL